VVALAVVAALGSPIWSEPSSGARLRAPFHWQLPPTSLTAAQRLLAVLHPGERVLAPGRLSISLAVSSSEVTTVAPRDYYLTYLRHDPTFHYADRLALSGLVNDTVSTTPPDLAGALRRVGVDVVCTLSTDTGPYDAVRALGYRPLLATADYRCLHRT
jgi:hypothetical protein